MTKKKNFYRFRCGTFIKAPTFEEAKEIFISSIQKEVEDEKRWHACTCLGLSHRLDCPENPVNKGEIVF